ncbi:MAG TPA: hypothetical protein VLQ65_14290, partial [Saliniramus sp.]|nr:hypothetical protein [Saliniramus sp.]
MPDETIRSRRDHARRDDVGGPAEADPRSRAGGLGRDDAPGQLVMREVLEKLGVEGPFKTKAASGEAGPQGASPEVASEIAEEGFVEQGSVEQILGEHVLAGPGAPLEQASTGGVPTGELPPVEVSLDATRSDAEAASPLQDLGGALSAMPAGNSAGTTEPSDDAPISEASEGAAALAVASKQAQGAALE